MMLRAAVVPPLETLDDLAHALRAAVNDIAAPRPEVRKRSVLRLGGHASRVADAPISTEDLLQLVEPGDMQILIAQFGNLTTDQAFRLAQALGSASLSPAFIRIAGATVMDSAQGQTIWAELEGDVVGLSDIARSVSGVAQRLGYRFDRRRFQPRIHVATVTEKTAAAGVAAAVVFAALDEFESAPWVVDHVSLLKSAFHPRGTEMVEAARVDLAQSS